MSIANFGELKTAVADLLHRSDLTTKIPNWISMAESRLNRDLLMLDTLTTQTGTVSTSTYTLALPSNYSKKIQFRINDPLTELTWVEPEIIRQYQGTIVSSGMPQRYTVTDTLEFDLIPNREYSYTFRYYAGYELVNDGDTNYLLTNYPQAYLYTTAIHACVYTRDFDMAAQMNALATQEIATIKRAEALRSGSDDARLTTEIIHPRNRFSIYRG